MQKSRLWYFVSGRWIKMFNPPRQQEFIRKARVSISFLPFGGKEREVRKLVSKYFPIEERNKVMKSLRHGSNFFTDVVPSGLAFVRELEKLTPAINPEVEEVRYESIVFFDKRDWYTTLEDVFADMTKVSI